ncbi:MAG TPA: cytochrome P450 [Actinomycetota bacterium]|nr:cytochrome P450 [Actinomycetota bacterium]
MVRQHLTAADLGFDPWDPGFVADPYPVYRELRERAPVSFFEPTGHWLVSRYEDVNRTLRDRRFGRTYLHVATHEEMGREPPPGWQAPFWRVVGTGMLDLEPPDHTRLRRLVSRAFTPRMVESLRPRLQAIMDALVDEVAGAGEVDLVQAVAEPLPVAVIAELLGVPPSDRHLLRPWSAAITAMFEMNPTEEVARRAVRAAEEFAGYLRELARERRARPGPDLVSELAQVVEEGDRLTQDELVGTCVLLLNAGHEATVNATGTAWLALFRAPDQLERLRRDPSLVPLAVEELLRFDTPLQLFRRYALEDAQVGGVPIARGAKVALLFGSANRDPSVFPDPDRLDVSRDPNPHLAFGAGIHFCLGAPVARLELHVSFATLLRRLPRLELATEPRWKPGYVIRGPQELRVRV